MAGATVEEISSKAPPAVAKSTPTAAKLGCAFSHSAERTVEVSLSQPCFEHFFGPVLGAMMKQVCWHSRRSEAHGDSNLYNTRQD